MQKYDGQLLRKFEIPLEGIAYANVSITVRDFYNNNLSVIYSDSEGTAFKSNPFTSDENGYYNFYAPDGKYKIFFANGAPTLEITLYDLFADQSSTVEGIIETATLDLDFAKNKHVVVEAYGPTQKLITDAVACARTSTDTYIGPFSLNTASANIPLIEYDAVNKKCLGVLVNPAVTNLLLRNSEFDNASWSSKARCAVTANTAIAPNNALEADFVYHSQADATDWYIGQSGAMTAGTIYTSSVWFKPSPLSTSAISIYLHSNFFGANIAVAWDKTSDEAVVIFGTPFDYGSVKGPNGWRRLWVAATATITVSAGFASLIWARNGTVGNYTAVADPINEGYYLWGSQLEANTYPSSVVPTIAAQVARSDSRLRRDMANAFNQEAGALCVSFIGRRKSSLERILAIGDASSTNECSINGGASTSSNKTLATIRAGGVNLTLTPANSVEVGEVNSAILRYRKLSNGTYRWDLVTNDGELANSGAGVISPSLPTGFDKLAIGHRHYYNTTYAYGLPIVRVIYIPKDITDLQMKEIAKWLKAQ